MRCTRTHSSNGGFATGTRWVDQTGEVTLGSLSSLFRWGPCYIGERLQCLNPIRPPVSGVKWCFMKSEIAVATVLGKAYYRIVKELKQRKLIFLSLVPGKPIPPSIRVVITTVEEKPSVNHPNVLVYDTDADPADTIDEAARLIRSKESYEELAIGVDPGKTFGTAVLGDGKILKTAEWLSLEMTVDAILGELKRNPARVQRIRIGNGIPKLAEDVAARLSIALPDNAVIEIVSEAGTSSSRDDGFRKKLSDADSAIHIAEKPGTVRSGRKNA